MQNPDDILVRTVFSDPAQAGPLLRQALPPLVAAEIDWSSLTAAPDAVVAGGILPTGVNTDLLFAARLRGSGEAIWFLLERRGKVSQWAVLEVLEVVTRIMERCHELDPEADVAKVVAVVVHHGRERWDAPTSLHQCYGLDTWPTEVREAVEPLLLRFEFVLYDLAAMSEGDLLYGWRRGRPEPPAGAN